MMQLLPASPLARWTVTRRRRAACWLSLALCFTIAAIWSMWPAMRLPYAVLPSGTSASGTVPMLNAWTIWWNADRLSHGLADYWNAPIFHPVQGAFAFSEPQPMTMSVAPIVWLTGSPMPAYHFYVVASLVLNGLFAVRLLRVLGAGWLAATSGGLAMLLHPLVHLHGDVLQMMPLWAVLWTIEGLVKLYRRPSWRRGVELGLAFAAVLMCSMHHGLFLALLLLLSGWLLLPPLRASGHASGTRTPARRRARWQRWLIAAALAAAVAAILAWPLVWPMRQILHEHQFARHQPMVQAQSARLADWLQLPASALLALPRDHGQSSRALAPGWLRVGLALLAVIWCLRRPVRQRRTTFFLAALACGAVVWSLGLNLSLGSWQPWQTLSTWLPPFSQVRSAFRFAYFAHLAVILLAALGLDWLLRWLMTCSTAVPRWLALSGLVVLAAAVAWEVPPPAVRLVGVPDVSVGRGWTAFLREQTPDGRAIVCLPFAAGYSVQEFDQATRWMLYGAQHGAPLVNGYSGFFPEEWFQMARALRTMPLDDETLARLARADVEFIVVDTRLLPPGFASPTASGRWQLTRVYRDRSGIEIWRLE